MHTNIKGFLVVLFILIIVADLRGQSTNNLVIPNTLSTPYLNVTQIHIIPLFDSICYHWGNSPLADILSYATIVPHIGSDNDTIWHIRIEQLYDFDVLSLVFPGGFPESLKPFVPFGLLNFKNRIFFVGIENTVSDYRNNTSRQIVEAFFQRDPDYATFRRDSLDSEIRKSDFIMHCDTIRSLLSPEISIDKTYTALMINYSEHNKSFVLVKKKMVKSPWE